MCGRFYIDDKTAGEIQRLIKHIDRTINYRKAKDIHPSQPATIIIENKAGLNVREMKWGFPQFQGKGLLINARAETVKERRTFQDSVLQRRCIIPAKGFYEWNSSKNKVTFFMPEKPAMFMAGFFQYFKEERFIIITTKANDSVIKIHDRMPLLLEEHELKDWLHEGAMWESLLLKTPPLLKKHQEYQQQTLF